MKKITLLIQLMLIAFVTTEAQVSSLTGAGLVGDPYLIGTKDELVFMRDSVNKGATGYPTAYYRLTANIDLSTYTDWSPIGSTTNPFKGTFDGSGFKITHLKTGISGTPTSTGNVGLFAVVTDATVANLSVETEGIYATAVTNAGILAATVTGAIISNCNVSGIVSVANTTNIFVGGLIGKSSGSKIINCMADITITANGSGASPVNSGGLVGNLSTGTFQGTASVNSYIYNSYSNGSVYSSSVSSVIYTGGIAGNIAGGGYIYNCYSSATVKGECTSGSANVYVGGIIGQGAAGLDIKNCIALNSSLICINATGNKQIGRIAGATINTAINYDADYGLETMTVQTGTASTTLATVNLGTKLITNKQGGDLGSNLPKDLLKAYLTSNTAPNGTSWLNWTSTAGVNNGNPVFIEVTSAIHNIDDANAMRAFSSNGVVTVVNIEVGKSIEIYSTTGVMIAKKIADGNRLDIALPKGIYCVRGIRSLVVNQ